MKKSLFAIALMSTLLITACKPPAYPGEETQPVDNIGTTETTETGEAPSETTDTEENTESAPETSDSNESEETAGEAFQVLAYSAESRKAVHGKKPYILNFRASWCPTCKALGEKVRENIDKLPKGTVMLDADYDEEVELKKEYKVTNQTTLIFFDAEGNQIASQYNPSIEKMTELLTQ